MQKINSIFKHTAVMAFTLVCVMGCDGKAQSQSSNATTVVPEQVDAVVETVPQTLEDCVSFPLVDTGGEPEFQPDGTPTYPISFFGIGFGQKVDHLPPCPVDSFGIPKVGYAEEVCVWYDDEDMQKLTQSGGIWKDIDRHGWIMYPWNYCGNKQRMNSVFGLDKNGYIIYLTFSLDGTNDQDEIYQWIYNQMGEPNFYVQLDPKTNGKAEIFEKGLPETFITLTGRQRDNVMVAIWQNDDYFIRLMPGVNVLDIGQTRMLKGSQPLMNLYLQPY